MQKKTYIELEYHEFESMVYENFPYASKYEYAPDEECSNYTKQSYDVDGVLDKYDSQKLENKQTSFMASVFLNKMCADGIIEPGRYLINVSW